METPSSNGALPFDGDVKEEGDTPIDRSTSVRSGRNGLSLDELALLLSSGVPTYRVIHTVPSISRATGITDCQVVRNPTYPPVPPRQ